MTVGGPLGLSQLMSPHCSESDTGLLTQLWGLAIFQVSCADHSVCIPHTEVLSTERKDRALVMGKGKVVQSPN
jgi:hypothetical protein